MNFLGNLKRLKKLLNGIIPQQKSRPRGWQSRRLAQFEMLESRELLAVNVLGPVTAYAQPNNPAEIQFDLTTNGNTATKFDFTVQRSSGSTLDPAQLRLINRSNGQLVVLSDIANGTTSSSASAMLATGSYSIFVSADGGKGNFTFVISQDSPIKSGLDLLVMAAIAQQQQPGSWANRVAYYNGLLANTSYAGAASAIPIVKYYPEVDVNGDGKIDLTDNAIAKQNAGSASGSVNSYNVAKNDPVPETIQDSGNGNITVPSNHRVQSVAGQTLQAGQSKTLPSGQGTITLKTDGSLTFAPSSSFIQQLAHGETKTVSVPVVTQDIYGNEYSFAAEFTVTGQNELPTLKDSTPINLTFDQTAGSGTVKTSEMLAKWSDPDHGAKLSIINPVIQTASSSNVALNSKYTPASLKQYLSLTGTGITFTVSDSFFDELGLNETLTINVSYGVKDEYGQSLNTGTLNITVKGKDNPSVVTEKQTTFQINSNDMNNPVKPVNAGFSVTDPDRKDATGFVYSFSNVKDNSTTAVNGLITGFNTTNGTFNIDTSKLKNRSVNSVVTVDIFVKSASGGVVSKTLTINLTPLAIPVASPLVLTTTETNQQTGNVTPKVSGTAGFKTTGLTIVNASGYGTLPNGVSLSTAASLDENGNFVFTPGKNFEYLKQGETLKLKFQYAITDTQYGLTGIGTIDLTITGTASTPTGLNNQTIGDNGKFNATENNGTVSKITVSKSEILSGWTLPDGLEAYSIVAGTSSFEKWSGNDGNPLETDSLGSVNIDSSGNLVFWSDSQSYKKLGKGQWLDVAVPVFVRDASGAEYSIGKVLFRVYGANNAPKLNCTKNSFTFALNSTESVSINPGFTTNDPDLNDRTNWKFSIDQASTDCGFSIDATGIISISNDAKYKLDSGDYMINVTLSDNNGGTAAKDIKVHFFEESAPTIQNITISGTEDESSFGYNLNDAITISNTQNYSIEISELKQILLNENSYPNNLNGRYEVSFDSQTGDFIFTPQPNFFKFLTAGDTLSFQFEYTVSNNNYVNCQSTGLLIVNIIGVNDLPVQTSGQNQAIYDVTESKNAESITINNLLNGWNDADHDNNVLKISEVNIYGLEGNVLTLTELQNVELFTISENGRNLIFNPSHEIFRKLGYGEKVTLTVSYTVTDPKGGSGTGYFNITVNGNNDPPELNFGNFTWQFNESDVSKIIDLAEAEYVTDLDKNDSHLVIQINGENVSQNDPITLNNGATVTYLGELKIQYELNGQFEYLSKDVTASDELSITITDSKTDSSTSTQTLNITITGENDAPTITGNNSFSVTNSGVTAGNTIDVGTFEITDIDNNDTLIRSIEVTQVTKDGQNLADIPKCFNIDEYGNVTMINTGLPNLDPGESATFTATISVNDSYITTTKEISVTVYAKKLPKIQLIDNDNDNDNEITKIEILEDENISQSFTISVTDAEEEFIAKRTGNNWYNTPSLFVSVDQYSGTINELSSLFSIGGDAKNGYTLNFNAETNTFDFLKKDKQLTFTVIVNVTDNDYDVTATRELTLTVTGTGDQHTVSNSSIDFWANERIPELSDDPYIGNENNTVTFEPNYEIDDADIGDTYQYSLTGNFPDGISIHSSNGNIILDRTKLTETTTYTLNINVTSEDGLFDTAIITLNIKFADAPLVDEIETIAIYETEKEKTVTIDITKPSDNVERNDENWYEIDNLFLKEHDGTIPNGFDIKTIASKVAYFEDNTFKFKPDTFFDFLPAGTSLTLTYQFTVFDTKYDAKTEKTIDVTIIGKNTKPEWKNETEDLGKHYASDDQSETEPKESQKLCSIDDLVKDVDLNDSHSLATINEVEITENTWVGITDGNENSLGEFYYNSETKNLYYRATGEYLAKIRHDEPKELQFNFVVKDNSNAETKPKDFTITVIGTNKPPVARAIEPYILTPTSQPLVIHIDDIAMDINDDDELSFYSIRDSILDDTLDDEIFEIEGAIKIQFDKKSKTMTLTILNDKIWSYIESLNLEIVVADNSNANNCRSEKIIIKIKLTKNVA